MISVKFYCAADKRLLGFDVKGHAGYGNPGEDIVCASVSSAVMLTVNNITDVFNIKAKAKVLKNEVLLKLTEDPDKIGDKLLAGLSLHLKMLCEDFPQAIKVSTIQR